MPHTRWSGFCCVLQAFYQDEDLASMSQEACGAHMIRDLAVRTSHPLTAFLKFHPKSAENLLVLCKTLELE